MRRLGLFALVLASTSSTGFAYEPSTHMILSEVASSRSVLYGPTLLSDLGYGAPESELFPFGADNVGIKALVQQGAAEEDDLTLTKRVYNHFFDPQHPSPPGWLIPPYQPLPGRGLDVQPVVTGYRSPDWALEDFGDVFSLSAIASAPNVPQLHSFRNGQERYFSAMTSVQRSTRRQEMATVFMTLGHVIHHLQDMAQPQHTRNDPHTPYQETASWYERYTEHINGILKDTYLSVPYNNGNDPSFPTAREYWTQAATPGHYRSMADFSAYNYVSSGTNYTGMLGVGGVVALTPDPNYPLPTAMNSNGTPRTVQAVSKVVLLENAPPVTRNMDYVVGSIYDEYNNTYTPNRLLAVTSVFNHHLSMRSMPLRFGVNSATFDSNYPVLFPRAVAFSSGLINHFFRGRLGLARSGNTTDWVITNTGSQALNGEFRIYRDDASGARTQTGSTWTQSLAAGAQASIAVAEPPLGTSRLTVVFRGQIGQEGSVSSGFYAVAARSVSFTPLTVACNGTRFDEGGIGGIEYVRELGNTAGSVQLQFEAFGIPDGLKITSENAAHTPFIDTGIISGFRSDSFPFDPATLGSSKVRVKVTAPDPSTWWTNVIGCPGQGLTPANGGLTRRQVVFKFGAALQNAVGSCTVQAQIDRGSFFTASVSNTGPGQATATMTEGPSHEIRFQNFSCQSGTQNITTAVTYTDSTGTHALGNMNSTSPIYFNVN